MLKANPSGGEQFEDLGGQIASEVKSGDSREKIMGEAYLEVVDGGAVLAELVGYEEEHRSVIVERLWRGVVPDPRERKLGGGHDNVEARPWHVNDGEVGEFLERECGGGERWGQKVRRLNRGEEKWVRLG